MSLLNQVSVLQHRSIFLSNSVLVPPKGGFLKRKKYGFSCMSIQGDSENDYLIDAPVSVGDGFSFSGGKYSDGPSPSDEWFKRGKMVKAHPVLGSGGRAKDPIFGLTMGAGSQASADVFR